MRYSDLKQPLQAFLFSGDVPAELANFDQASFEGVRVFLKLDERRCIQLCSWPNPGIPEFQVFEMRPQDQDDKVIPLITGVNLVALRQVLVDGGFILQQG